MPVPLLLLALAEDPDAWKWRLRRTSNERRRAASRVGSTDGFASNLHLRMDSPPNVEDLNSSRRVLSFLVSFKGASTFTFTHAYNCYSDLYTHAFYLTSQWSALYDFFFTGTHCIGRTAIHSRASGAKRFMSRRVESESAPWRPISNKRVSNKRNLPHTLWRLICPRRLFRIAVGSTSNASPTVHCIPLSSLLCQLCCPPRDLA